MTTSSIPLPESRSETTKPRSLKIEITGDAYYRKTRPLIRLSGRWLEQAGFKPGHRVEILSLKPGELSLQFRENRP